uniref:Uncharacterized protein n=1 Tax=Arion vulgaris TaxID=1028688 RepID=A0A0B6Y3K9_9EUPU
MSPHSVQVEYIYCTPDINEKHVVRTPVSVMRMKVQTLIKSGVLSVWGTIRKPNIYTLHDNS